MEQDELFEQIRSGERGRDQVISQLYRDTRLRNGIKKILQYRKGTEEDFNEIFNYTLVQFMKSVIGNRNFEIRTNLNSYLFGIAKFLWLKKINKRESNVESLSDDFDTVDNSPLADLLIMKEEKKDILIKVLSGLGVKCKEVLMYWASGYKMKEIAKLLSYSSEDVVRRKKYTCMKEISKYLNKHPQIKDKLSI